MARSTAGVRGRHYFRRAVLVLVVIVGLVALILLGMLAYLFLTWSGEDGGGGF
jgi:uncharacterized protein involved in cysteine biosynthesis